MKKLLSTFFVSAFALAATQAAVVFNFNSKDYVSGNVQLRNTDGSTPLALPYTGRAFNTTGALISTAVTGYTGGPAIYGGMEASVDSFSLGRVSNNGAGPFMTITKDYFAVRLYYATTGSAQSFHFLAGGLTSDISFNSSSSVTFGAIRNTNTGHSGNARLVIGRNGSYFISNNTVNVTGTYSDTLNFGDLTTLTWLTYDPVTSISTIGSSATPFLNEIDYVGVRLTMNLASNARTGNKTLALGRLTVDAIPEPSTWALLAIGMTALVIFRRRRAIA